MFRGLSALTRVGPAGAVAAAAAPSATGLLAASASAVVAQASTARRAASGGVDRDTANYPGVGASAWTTEMNFVSHHDTIPTYRVLDDNGEPVAGTENSPAFDLDDDTLIKMFKTMVATRIADQICYQIQRQGTISFYMTATGEEACVGAAAALDPSDVIFLQYRELYMLLYQDHVDLTKIMNQLHGNANDPAHGVQMPVHHQAYPNIHTISSPLTTQLPHAAGAAYALKMQGKDAVSAVFFGDGAASEGDAHAALNFAATRDAPCIFFCRNNGFAISTPTSDQYRGDGIASRGPGYGIPSIRVDGNDALAVYSATKAARDNCLANSSPALIEAMTYRGGHHSTSDDSTRYRDPAEIDYWLDDVDPIKRFKKYLTNRNLWSAADDKDFAEETRATVNRELDAAHDVPLSSIKYLFDNVTAEMSPALKAQRAALKAHLEEYGHEYPLDRFEGDFRKDLS